MLDPTRPTAPVNLPMTRWKAIESAHRDRVAKATHEPGNPHELHTGARDACPDDRCRAYLRSI